MRPNCSKRDTTPMMPYLTCGVWKNSVSTPIPTTTPPQCTSSPLPLFSTTASTGQRSNCEKKKIFDPLEKGKHMTHSLATKMALSGLELCHLKLSTRGHVYWARRGRRGTQGSIARNPLWGTWKGILAPNPFVQIGPISNGETPQAREIRDRQ